jgi:hypothetical protein
MELVKMIQELEPEEKNMVFKMVDTFLTKKKFKDFFQKMLLLYNQKARRSSGLFALIYIS